MSKSPRKTRARKPKHPVEVRAFRFPMDVTKQQSNKLFATLESCWRLRNKLAQDRIEDRNRVKELLRNGEKAKYLTCSDQYTAVKAYAKADKAWGKLHSQVRQNVAVRVDEGYKRFLEALKEGRPNVKPPKLIDLRRYRSFTYPQYGTAAHIKNGRAHLSGLGEFRVRDYRKIRGKKKTVTIKWAQGRWWCIVTAEMQIKDAINLPKADDQRLDAGGDPGLSSLLVDSHGQIYDPPKAWHDYRAKLRTAQKKLSRQFLAREKVWRQAVKGAKDAGLSPPKLADMPYSNRLKKQLRVVGRLHTKIANIRDYHHKKNAAILEDRYRQVAIEDHGVQFMIRNRKLAKLASDRAIHKQKLVIKSKLGKRYVPTANRREGIGGNSQSCVCGAAVPKKLSDRVHACSACGLLADRDHVSANIVQLIAFGTVSDSLKAPRQPGRLSSDVEKPKVEAAKAASPSRRQPVSEVSVKRRSPASRRKRPTTDGEPTVAGKTIEHSPGFQPALPFCAETVSFVFTGSP